MIVQGLSFLVNISNLLHLVLFDLKGSRMNFREKRRQK